MGTIWTVCSGNGGVGKTTIALSIAAGAAKAGKKTILVDACGIARSCDLALGLESVMTLDLKDVLHNQVHMDAALDPVARYENLRITCTSLHDQTPVCDLSSMILALHSMCDVLVIDMPTGQCSLGRGMMRGEDRRLFVVRPDDASIRSTERMMMLPADSAMNELIINRISKDRIKRKTQYPQSTVESLLDLPALACIPEDSGVSECEHAARAAIESSGPAKSALNILTKALLSGA